MSGIRVGLIGAGRGRGLMRVCQTVGSATVTAIYDPDEQRAATAAAELGAQAVGTLAGLLTADLEAVVVASPVPFHAEQSIAALQAGKHVLSEVTACQTLAEARALVGAVRASGRCYMLAENCCYLDEIELVRRLNRAGAFGTVYYGEGDYVHDCQPLWRDAAGRLTWRGRGDLGVYGTHGLGPLLYILDDRVTTVSALAVPGGQFDPAVTLPTMHLLQMTTAASICLRMRVDHVSPRPHEMTTFYGLQGTRGVYESVRGGGDAAKIWLADRHPVTARGTPAAWQPLAALATEIIPDRLVAPATAGVGGHGTSEYWLLHDFLSAVRGERPCPIDVYAGLDYTLPGICAVESAARNGQPVTAPDPRAW